MTFRKIFSNTFAILIARIIYRVFNAMVAIIIARYLGVEKFGMYSTALALVNTFLIANDIGSTTLIMKEGSRDKSKIDLYFGNSLIIQLIASAIFFALAFLMSFILGYDKTTILLVLILGSATIIFEFRKSFRSVLRILLKLKFIALVEAFTGLFIFISTYIISKYIFDKDTGLILIALVPLCFNIMFILSVFIYDIKFVKPKFSWPQIWPMIKQGYIYSIYNIFYIAYFQICILMVQAMRGDIEAGLYSASAKLIILLLIIPQMIFQVALPLMFKYFKEDLNKYKRIHLIIFRYLVAFGIPISMGILLLSDEIIELVYHKAAYQPAALGLQLLSLFVLARFIGNVSGQSLTTIDKQQHENAIQIISFILLGILGYFLITLYGFIGAIIATIIIEFIIRISFVITDFYFLKQKISIYLFNMVKPAMAAIIMSVFLYFTKTYLNVIFSMILGAVIYGFFLWLFGFLQPYDIKLFKQLKLKK